ncbi:hypothetical protein H4F33_17685 [Pectobacterium brasiliense]|uniref:hypothetical protein n=1 Tax=Enterobacterales TaxID=91347 RepID=UPI0015DD7D77|nr:MULTISPECIES: hypothetical protein [Enterobacterales]MBA0219755.1 hypothetical protein [Pectobacterium brasiliense]MBN3073907.1 hypothetical protein [Pectobacterium brasiliense]MBN3170491.1 hypothetical protein [Pectobacterium brasiliense]MCR9000977.1 hypothetical protein [Rahnella perminowiae]
MKKDKFEWGKEIVQTGSDVAALANDVGIPGIGLVAKFVQHFYDKQLQKRFEKFISDADINKDLLDKIAEDETYSNCFYAILEAVRQTHSKIGLVALALIYRNHWNDEQYLIAAVQAFSQISDATINSFISLYEEISDDEGYLILRVSNEEGNSFHEYYNEAVELIRRNFFVLSTGSGMHANGPVQGMKWFHTESYYTQCKLAKNLIG